MKLSDRLLTWQIEMRVFLTFRKKKTANERWHSLASRMGDRKGYLEPPPAPAPPLESVRTDARTFADVLITIFLGLMGYQFFLLMVHR